MHCIFSKVHILKYEQFEVSAEYMWFIDMFCIIGESIGLIEIYFVNHMAKKQTALKIPIDNALASKIDIFNS